MRKTFKACWTQGCRLLRPGIIWQGQWFVQEWVPSASQRWFIGHLRPATLDDLFEMEMRRLENET